ncbi:hypothetical protein DFQ30_000822, partial [Apophysomyces sp. BC1015]
PPEIPLGSLHKCITHLALTVDYYPDWLDLAKKCSRVEKLEIGGTSFQSANISVSDLEVLHEILTGLRSLSFDDVGIIGEMPETITPCDTVLDLTLTPVNSPILSQYIAQKYRKIERLCIRHMPLPPCQTTEAQVIAMARSFRRLKWFQHDTFLNCLSFHKSLLKIFREIGAPLANLQMEGFGFSSNAATINNFKETLSKV